MTSLLTSQKNSLLLYVGVTQFRFSHPLFELFPQIIPILSNDAQCVQLLMRVLVNLAVLPQDKIRFLLPPGDYVFHLEDQCSSLADLLEDIGRVFPLTEQNRSKLETVFCHILITHTDCWCCRVSSSMCVLF